MKYNASYFDSFAILIKILKDFLKSISDVGFKLIDLHHFLTANHKS